jgi:acyl carrier protein
MVARALSGIAPEADLSAVGDDEDLREVLDLDSMDFLNFLVELGRASAVNIPEAHAPRLRTMAGLVAYFAPVPEGAATAAGRSSP